MNRIIKLIIILISFSFIATSQNILQRGFPMLHNFEVNETGGETQNWAIDQAPNGFMYFGNNDGVLEYDGSIWRLLDLPFKATIRSIAIDSTGRIYIGAVREFGYLQKDSIGKLKYHSISSKLDSIKFEDVWRIILTRNGVYFDAGHHFIYKYNNNKLSKVFVPKHINNIRISYLYDTIFINDNKYGFGFIKDDSVKLFHNRLKKQFSPAYFLLPNKKHEKIVGFRLEGLYKLSISKTQNTNIDPNLINKKYTLTPVNKTLNKYLSEGELYYGTSDENYYYFATLRKGFFITNHNFEILNHLGYNDGINTNDIFSIKIDKSKNIWLATEKGITYIKNYSPFTFFNKKNGLSGIILFAKTINKDLYIGTTIGLYKIQNNYKNLKTLHKATVIYKRYSYSMDLIPIKNTPYLLTLSLRDILLINSKNLKTTSILKRYGSINIVNSPLDTNNYYISSSEGIECVRLKKTKNSYTLKSLGRIKNFNENCRAIEFDYNNNLWVSSGFNGIFKIALKNDTIASKIKHYTTKDGLPKLYNNTIKIHNDTIFVGTNNGFYYYNSIKNIFTPYNNINSQITSKNFIVSQINYTNNHMWFISNYGLYRYNLRTKKIESSQFNFLKNYRVAYITNSNDKTLWACGVDNIIAINISKINKQISTTDLYIRNIIFGTDTLTNIKNNAIIPFNNNSLHITVACPDYQSINKLQFSYRLKGLSDKWSAWTSNPKKEYSYLPAGKYQLTIRAGNLNKQIISKKTFSFEITPPFYQTRFAITLYILATLLMIYLIIYLNNLRLRNDRLKLARAVNNAVSLVNKQKRKLSEQAKILSKTNEELKRLSIVAQKTDNAVSIMDATGNYLWINEGFNRMYGYTLEELKNDNNRKKIGRNSNLHINDLINIWYGDKKPITYESKNKHSNGTEIWVQTTLTPITDNNGNVEKLIAIDTDISKIKEAESQIQKQRDEIKQQRDIALLNRDEIMQQKQEITDSIHYAKKIQSAVLPSPNQLNKIFEENFILNIPRDIVSGDFFWCHAEGHLKILAVADCTGHGVPGAFMSLIGINFLNNIVLNKITLLPNKILDNLREDIITSLDQSEEREANKDGMDIAVISYDTKKKLLNFSGANNSIFIKRNNKLITLQADRMPISLYRDIKTPFSIQTIKIEDGDVLFMFSDGYRDQFGGFNKKKLKSNRFKDILLNLPTDNFNKQGTELRRIFMKWKGELEQVDDVIVIGIKF